MIWLSAIVHQLKLRLHKKKENIRKPDELFHGPFQPCEVFDSPSMGRIVARTIHTERDIIFPYHYHPWDVTNWLFYRGYSIGSVSFDSTIKLTHDF